MRNIFSLPRFGKTLLICLLFVNLFFIKTAGAIGQKSVEVEVIMFVREGCKHCREAEKFITQKSKDNKDFNVRYYRLEKKEDREKWEKVTSNNKIAKVTPITIIGKKYIVGFDSPETTGELILELTRKTRIENILTDINSKELKAASESVSACDENGIIPCDKTNNSVSVSLPIIGEIESDKYPLIILAAILGFFDGFNPCAMWVLITFLLILMQVGNRRKMLLFAGTFVLAEAVMYSLILTVWYKTWDFVQLDSVVTPFVGGLSILGGIFFLREWRKKELECKVADLKSRAQTRKKIIELAENKFTVVTFLSILAIAFSVNIIEFACSVGIPQAFTKILELNGLSLFESLWYIGIYILFYMIDDFIVFAIALWGFDKMALTTKYSKISNLFGGLVMIIIGLILIFFPGLLRF